MNHANAEQKFERRIKAAIQESIRIGHDPTTAKTMVRDLGAVEAAKRLVKMPGIPYGIKQMRKLGRLDLTIEALILKDEFECLFTDEEKEAALSRLEELKK